MSLRITAVILAAGKGTRLKSELPKVLHEICGRPMLAYVFDACREADVRHIVGVVGHRSDLVRDAFAGDRDIDWVIQEPQLGTGHAVMVCREQIKGFDHALVLCGDGPLIRSEVVREIIQRHTTEGASATLATAVIDDPTGYGRIMRDERGQFRAIVEHGDATDEQRTVREVNPSYYCFKVSDLLAALDQIKPNNKKGEYYITDVLGLFTSTGKKVIAISSVRPEDIYSINSRKELALVNRVMRDRVHERLMESGVTIVDPATTWVDTRANIGRDTVVYPFTYIDGPARIGENCRVGPFVRLSGNYTLSDGGAVAGQTGGAR